MIQRFRSTRSHSRRLIIRIVRKENEIVIYPMHGQKRFHAIRVARVETSVIRDGDNVGPKRVSPLIVNRQWTNTHDE